MTHAVKALLFVIAGGADSFSVDLAAGLAGAETLVVVGHSIGSTDRPSHSSRAGGTNVLALSGARKGKELRGLGKNTAGTGDDVFSEIEPVAAHHAQVSEPGPVAEAVRTQDIGAVFAAGSQTRALPRAAPRARKKNLEVASRVVAPAVRPTSQVVDQVGTPPDVWAAAGVGYLLAGAAREATVFEIHTAFHADWTEISVSTGGAV